MSAQFSPCTLAMPVTAKVASPAQTPSGPGRPSSSLHGDRGRGHRAEAKHIVTAEDTLLPGLREVLAITK